MSACRIFKNMKNQWIVITKHSYTNLLNSSMSTAVSKTMFKATMTILCTVDYFTSLMPVFCSLICAPTTDMDKSHCTVAWWWDFWSSVLGLGMSFVHQTSLPGILHSQSSMLVSACICCNHFFPGGSQGSVGIIIQEENKLRV